MSLLANTQETSLLAQYPHINNSISSIYDHNAYDSLLSLGEASNQFKDTNAASIIAGPLRNLFLRHNAHKYFGIALLHKHFEMEPTQRLVDCRNVAGAWGFFRDPSAVVSRYSATVFPRSYRFLSKKWQPYEFEYSNEVPTSPNLGLFLQELSLFLDKYGMTNLLGIRILGHQDPKFTVEVTEENMNVMISKEGLPEENLISTLWIFKDGPMQELECVEFCMYNSYGSHVGKAHHECD